MKQKLTIQQKSRIHAALFLTGAAVMILGCFLSEPLDLHFLVWLGAAVFIGSAVYRITAIKCPHCGSSMYYCRTIPHYCPDCGEKLF